MRGKGKWAHLLLVVVVVLPCVLLGPHVRDLRIRVHDLELLPQSSEVLEIDETIRQHFGSDERFIICFESSSREVSDPVFIEDFRFFLRELIRTQNIGVLVVDRLYRARFGREPIEGEPYFLHLPDAGWIEHALRASALTSKFAAGASRNAAFLETPALSGNGVRSIEVKVYAALAELEKKKPGQYSVRVVGRHVVLNGLGEAIFEDLSRLLPWCFLVIFCLLLLIFRAPLPAALGLVEVGLAVLSTMGILQLLGHDLSLMTAMVPVLVTVLGVADEIHLFGEFYRLRASRPHWTAQALAWGAARRVLFPVTATTLTTAIGFLSFLATEVPALRVFGLLAGCGVFISWFYTLVFVPAVLALLPAGSGPRWVRDDTALSLPRILRGAFPLGLSLLVIPGILRLEIDDGWTRNFQPEHPIVENVRWFQRESVGLYRFDLMLERLDSRRWTDPAWLQALAQLAEEIEQLPVVTAAISVADLVLDRAWELGDPAQGRPPIPQSEQHIDRLLHTYRVFNEQVFLRSLLDVARSSTRLVIFTTGDDYATSSQARSAIEELVGRTFGHGAVDSLIGGSAERGRVLIETVVTSQARSVSASLLIAWLALGLASGRWWLALRCVFAITWALALVLGIAGWAGLSLGVASSCFLALGMGIGLDYGIHLAFGRARSLDGSGPTSVVHRRVLANVLVVGAGLSILMLSSNPTMAKLGLLIVLSMAASGYTALVVFTEAPKREAGSTPGLS